MRRFLFAALLAVAFACSRGTLHVIDHAPVPDASDTPANDTQASDTRVADTRANDTRPAFVCPAAVAASGDSDQTVTVGSLTRSYVLHIPSGYDGKQPVPLIFDFHLQNGSGTQQRSISHYPDQTDADGVVMAFPNGLRGPGGTAWNLGPCCVNEADDLAFTKAMIDQIQKSVCIDEKRIYAVGTYTGGGMAYLLACRAADIFAAVASSEWDLLEENVEDCGPSRPITVVSFRGTADTLVPYAGGLSKVVPGMPITFLGAQKSFQKWGLIDKCPQSSKTDGNGCSRYSDCDKGVEVVLCPKSGAGDVSDPGIAWPLLKQHPMP